jgi:hypothetical protein
MELVESFREFGVYAHKSGKGVIIINKNTRGLNAAVFPDVGTALNTALAVAWGNSLMLTHKLRKPIPAKVTESEAN